MMKAFTVISFLFVITGVLQSAPTRFAVLFGNDSYPNSPLRNARGDANAVSLKLTQMGYRTYLQVDATHKVMEDTIAIAANAVHQGDTVVFYYSGHGLSYHGENYLIPIDFKLRSSADVAVQGYSLSDVLQAFTKHGATTTIVILDACRDNPFSPDRGLQTGWAPVATSAGTFLAFGTSPGGVASDVSPEQHGLFTTALLHYLDSPTLTVDELFRSVREEVIKESHGLQIPWIATDLIGSIHLVPSSDLASAPIVPYLAATNQVSQNATDASRSLALSLSPTAVPPHANDANSRNASAGYSPPSGSTKSAEIFISQGLLLAQQGDYERAVRSLSSALAVDPRSSVALRVLGLIFHLLGRDVEATDELNRAIATDPTDEQAYYYRCLGVAAKDPVSAVRDCEASIGLNPNFAGAHLGLANALLLLGQPKKAYNQADEAIRLDSASALGYAMRGKIAASLGEESRADRDYERAMHLTVSQSSTVPATSR